MSETVPLFDPTIPHEEGVTSGTTTLHTPRQSQMKNQQMMQQKWSKSKKPSTPTTPANSSPSTVASSLPPTPPPVPTTTPSSATTTTTTVTTTSTQKKQRQKKTRSSAVSGGSGTTKKSYSTTTTKRITNAVKNSSPFNLFRVKNKLLKSSHRHQPTGGRSSSSSSGNNDNENTPLIANASSPMPSPSSLFSSTNNNVEMMEQGISGGSGTTTFATSPSSNKSSKISKGWKKVIDHKKKGDFLLLGNAAEPNEDVDTNNNNTIQTHEEKVQEAIDEIRSGMEFTLFHCIVAIFVYLAIAVICYHYIFLERSAFVNKDSGGNVWTIIDTIYFAVTTFTTVGYGDLSPQTRASRLFTCCYAFLGVSILGIALGILGSNLIDAQDKAISKAQQASKNEMLNIFGINNAKDDEHNIDNDDKHGDDHELANVVEYGYDDDGTLQERSLSTKELSAAKSKQNATTSSNNDEDDKTGCVRTIILQSAPLLVILLLLAFWIGDDSGWDWSETIYYFVISASTIGFGDYSPTTQTGKMIAIVFIPLAVASMGHWLGLIASWIIEGRSARHRKKIYGRELTQRDLDIMDEDGDGQVTRAEFLEFMLIAMNRIDKDLMNELRDHFDRLDVDGTGTLSRDDLVEVARRKVHTVRNKLHLAAYRERLLDQGRGDVHHRESFWGNLFGRNAFAKGLSSPNLGEF